jgi:rhodanese-related sulfurtransferase
MHRTGDSLGDVKRIATIVVIGVIGLAPLTACGSDSDSASTATTPATSPAGAEQPAGFTTVSADAAASIIDDAPEDLVVLDVRTAEEFAAGHIDGAVQLDFYRPDFADQLAQLDPTVPYVVYCRSGNRSGQTLPIMESLGFASASDVEGGILAWQASGLPVVVD